VNLKEKLLEDAHNLWILIKFMNNINKLRLFQTLYPSLKENISGRNIEDKLQSARQAIQKIVENVDFSTVDHTFIQLQQAMLHPQVVKNQDQEGLHNCRVRVENAYKNTAAALGIAPDHPQFQKGLNLVLHVGHFEITESFEANYLQQVGQGAQQIQEAVNKLGKAQPQPEYSRLLKQFQKGCALIHENVTRLRDALIARISRSDTYEVNPETKKTKNVRSMRQRLGDVLTVLQLYINDTFWDILSCFDRLASLVEIAPYLLLMAREKVMNTWDKLSKDFQKCAEQQIERVRVKEPLTEESILQAATALLTSIGDAFLAIRKNFVAIFPEFIPSVQNQEPHVDGGNMYEGY